MKAHNNPNVNQNIDCIIKNMESKKSISKNDLENIRTKITNAYNSSMFNKNILEDQTINAIYQIETNGREEKFILSKLNPNWINSMISIHNKVDKKSPEIKKYTMLLNSIKKDEFKNYSKTREVSEQNVIKKEVLHEANKLEYRIRTASIVLNETLKQHKTYFNQFTSNLDFLNKKESFEDKRISFNNQQSALSELINFEKPKNLDKKELPEIEKYVAKGKEHDKKLDDIIKGLKDITSIYHNLNKNIKENSRLTYENILAAINKHIDIIRELNSKI